MTNTPTPSTGQAQGGPEQKKKAFEIGLDLVKQLITLGFAGVAFAVGVRMSSTPFAGLWFWATVGVMIGAIALGFVFVMVTVATLDQAEDFNIYDGLLRALSGSQILLMMAGAVLLLVGVSYARGASSSKAEADAGQQITVEMEDGSRLTYPLTEGRSSRVQIEGGEVTVEPARPSE